MSVYIDTSVLVAVIFEESASFETRMVQANAPAGHHSDLVRLEFAAVVSRAVRTSRLDERAAATAVASLNEFHADSLPMSHGRGEFTLAERLIRDFGTKLTAPDALHLASAKNAGAALATLDGRLAGAARAQGVEVALG
jgi:uncharacterized protein